MNSAEASCLPLLCDTLPEKFRQKAVNELNETEGKMNGGLMKLRQYIKREDIQLEMNDEFLVPFLRTAKFDLKKAEQRLKKFASMKRTVVNLLSSMDMERVKFVMDHHVTGLLPYRDKDGRAVIYTLAYAWKKELFDLKEVAACMLSLIIFASSSPLTSVCGISYLCEAKFNSIYDLFPIGNTIRMYAPFVNAFPIRMQKVDVLNENYICRCFYLAIRPLLPQKLAKRVCLHKDDTETLFKDYPPSVRPSEFGGTMGPLNNEFYLEEFLHFVQNLKYGSMKHDRSGV